MPPFRNPFSVRKSPANGLEPVSDETTRPLSNGTFADGQTPKPSVALNIKGYRDEPNEFKLSAVNDSGVYLPPSPPEKKSFWHKSPHSSQSSAHRNMINENEAFTISRESFDSYRRSFDISGRSPVLGPDSYPSRGSLDSRAARLPKSAVSHSTLEKPGATEEEGFEDVGLNDEAKPKKRTFLSRFGEFASENPGASTDPATAPAHHGFHLPSITGRKRGQSGKGAELGNIERPGSRGKGDGVIR